MNPCTEEKLKLPFAFLSIAFITCKFCNEGKTPEHQQERFLIKAPQCILISRYGELLLQIILSHPILVFYCPGRYYDIFV